MICQIRHKSITLLVYLMKYLILILAAVVLTNCSKVEIYEVEGFEEDVIVNAIVSTDSTWVISLIYSQVIFDTADPVPVEDAEVLVTVLKDPNLPPISDNIEQWLKLDHQGNGEYALGTNPIEGKTYHLEIALEDKVITAQTYVPKVFEPTAEYNVDSKTLNIELERDAYADEEITYVYNLIYQPEPKNIDASGEDSTSSDSADEEDDEDDDGGIGSDPNQVQRNPGINSATPLGTTTTSISSSGASFQIESASLNIISDTSEEETVSDESAKRSYLLQIWAISSDYHEYLVSQSDNNFRPSSDITYDYYFSNIKNGLGIFAGYNLKELYIDIEE